MWVAVLEYTDAETASTYPLYIYTHKFLLYIIVDIFNIT